MLACEVLDNVPMTILPPEKFFVITIPSEKPLGLNEKDFSNVSVSLANHSGQQLEDTVKVFFVAGGKLGGLKGGLLFLGDFCAPLSREDIAGLAVERPKAS